MAKAPVFFICGDDEYLVQRQGAQLFDEKAAELDEFSRELVEGIANRVDEVAEVVARFSSAAQTVSLFGDRKVVWLKDINFLADNQTGRAEGTKKQVERLQNVLSELDPEGTEVLITACPVDRRKKEFKWFAKNTQFTDLKGEDKPEALLELLEQEAERQGASLTHGAAQALLGKISGSTRLLLEEVRKLGTYLGSEGGKIDERLVGELVPTFGEGEFFESSEAFFALDLPWTLDALRRHFFTKGEARPIISALQNRGRLCIQLRSLMDSGALKLGPRGFSKSDFAAAASRYGGAFAGIDEKSAYHVFTQNLWYLGNKIAPAAERLSLRRLIDFQLAFTEAFQALIDQHQHQELVMRNLAIRCLSE